jgi:hypothetical protein
MSSAALYLPRHLPARKQFCPSENKVCVGGPSVDRLRALAMELTGPVKRGSLPRHDAIVALTLTAIQHHRRGDLDGSDLPALCRSLHWAVEAVAP